MSFVIKDDLLRFFKRTGVELPFTILCLFFYVKYCIINKQIIGDCLWMQLRIFLRHYFQKNTNMMEVYIMMKPTSAGHRRG